MYQKQAFLKMKFTFHLSGLKQSKQLTYSTH